MKKIFFILILVFLVGGVFALARVFDSETSARAEYNRLVNAPRFAQVEVKDIINVLDDPTMTIYWHVRIYEDVNFNGEVIHEFDDSASFQTTDSRQFIQDRIEILAREKANEWSPPKTQYQNQQHPLFRQKFRVNLG